MPQAWAFITLKRHHLLQHKQLMKSQDTEAHLTFYDSNKNAYFLLKRFLFCFRL